PTSATRFTACSLNAAVYSCFGILIIFASKVTSILHYPWKTKFEGKLTPDPGTDNGTTDCAVASANAVNTGARSSCVSNWGVNDMVGNVWEWVADWMQGNTSPWAPSTGTAGASYGADWMYGTNPATAQGAGSTNFPTALLRGGSWFNGTFAGVFALYSHIGPSFSSSYFGFRCAR
ncbi:MAG: SUMF1/EgtB/PvdO family nonheme iron enzyme, partial [Nitrospirae bacterium]|nr:SUMF1/EgtB/PvdO family nonheme iron enzyme [Nitrospirota bacterium]